MRPTNRYTGSGGMQGMSPEARQEYYTWNNAVRRLAWSIAGGARKYDRMSRAERLEVRAMAKKLHELGQDVAVAHVAEKTEREGFVYVIGHPAWPDHLKVGRAFDPEARLRGYQTGCPQRSYRLLYARFFRDCHTAERAIHLCLDKWRRKGEWFYADLHEVAEIIDRQQEYEACGPRL